jgi:hypothetical protein
MLHALQAPIQGVSHPRCPVARVPTICPHQLQTREHVSERLEQQPCPSTILNVSLVHTDAQHQSQRVHQQVTFASMDLLVAVVPSRSRHGTRAHGLTVDHSGAWGGLVSRFNSDSFTQQCVPLHPHPLDAPLPQVGVHRGPRRQVSGEESSGATAAQNGEDGVDDVAHGVCSRSAARFGGWNEWFEDRPLGVGEVAGIAMGTHPSAWHVGFSLSSNLLHALQRDGIGFLGVFARVRGCTSRI